MRLELEQTAPATDAIDAVMSDAKSKDNSVEAKELLASGIKAAQSGDRAKARVSLLRAAELDSVSESAWLWLASISEYPEELLVFLTNVLEINPENRRAIEWTAATKSLLSKTFVQRGADAVEENKSDYAAQCFNQALEYDQNNSMAWLWMASLCDSTEGKIIYFEKVLSIDPTNETARSGYDAARFEIGHRQLSEARSAAVEGRSSEADELLNAIIAENPDSEDAWVLRAHLAQGFDAKIRAFEKVLDLNPSNLTARSGLDSLLSIIETVAPKAPAEESVTEPVELIEESVEQISAAPESESGGNGLPGNDLDLTTNNATLVIEPQVAASLDAIAPDGIANESEDVGFAMVAMPSAYEEDVDEYMQASNPFSEMAAEWTATSTVEITTDESFDNAYLERAFEHTMIEEHAAFDEHVSVADVPLYESELEDDSSIHETLPANADEPANGNYYHAYEAESDAMVFNAYSPLNVETVVACEVPELPAVDIFSQPAFQPSDPHEDQSLSVSDINVVGEGNAFSHVAFCSFCDGENDAQAVLCQTCRAVLTLSDLEMLLSNTNSDKLIIRDAVERMEAKKTHRELTETELTMLSIGHLNLHNFQFGYNYLQEASQVNPNNVMLSSQVNALNIRLDEIKRRDEAHETMPKGKTILVVDDSPTVRKLIAGKLEKCGHDVFCASDGVEAMERLDKLTPDLILLDITMPRMDGYQVCKLIRSNSVTQDVPVVMISGKDGFFDKVRGRMAGTTGYITKPFGPETLMKAVETYLGTAIPAEQVS